LYIRLAINFIEFYCTRTSAPRRDDPLSLVDSSAAKILSTLFIPTLQSKEGTMTHVHASAC
jgi:hypothetical protein